MARKWRLFFYRLFTVLKTTCRPSCGLRRVGYIVLGILSILGCLFVMPGAARVPLTDTPGAIAQTIPSISSASAEQLDQIARERYANGQFQEAAIAFRQAAQRYAAQGNSLQQALSLSNLSLSDQQLGLWTEATDAIAQSVTLLQTELQHYNTPDRQSAYAQALDIRAKLELSRGQAAQAIATWEQAISIHAQLGNVEQVNESQINQARALQRLGLYNRAIHLLQTVLQVPDQSTAQTPLVLEELETITNENTANDLLKQRLQRLTNSANANTVTALQNLGDALQIFGNLEQAQIILDYSLTLAQQLELPDAIAPIYLSLGNVTRAKAIADLQLKNMSVQQAVKQLQMQLSPVQRELQYRRTEAANEFDAQTEDALTDYQQATASSSPILQVQAYLNRLNLLLDKQANREAAATLAQIDARINRLPLTRTAIDAQINYAQLLRRMANMSSLVTSPSAQRLQAAQLLANAHQQAIALGDPQAESYALGYLGQLYEDAQQWTEAADLTQQALEKVNGVSVTNMPQNVHDADLAYRWHYQLGRIRAAQGDKSGAIASYEIAAKVLQDWLGLDVASSNLTYQFAFNQDAQQPVHLDWIDLLFQSDNPSQQDLQQVREISTSLLEVQLNSFLQEPCAIVSPQQVDRILENTAQRTAIFYPVILGDRLEVIVKLPGTAELQHYSYLIPKDELLEIIANLQIALEEDYTFAAIKDLSNRIYNWLVAPVAAQLDANQIDTLVFTLDRRLQSIPMAALYDGQQYLIEKYAISEILGLRFDGSERSLQPEELKVIGAGLSTLPTAQTIAGEDLQQLFLPLDYVAEEIAVIKASGIPAVTLEDEKFTLVNFNTSLNEQKFPIVHLATHGQFSFDPARTFLLTSEPDPVDVNKLSALFRLRGQIRLDAVELLILNACETAAGDPLATLGIAGAGIRAGARSAIASLWTLDDAPNVSFTRTLYEHLGQPGMSRAEAVRQAQLALLQDPLYSHPRYWSPYILAGNWLPLTSSRSTGTAASSTSS